MKEKIEQWNPKYLHIVGICLASSLIITNVFSVKIIELFGIKFGAGVFLFPFCLIIGDIMSELYGFRRSRQVIIVSLCCFLAYAIISQIIIALPPAETWPYQAAFEEVFSLAPRVVVAGSIAYLVGEISNSFVMCQMKKKSGESHFSLRAIVSTLVGELLNSITFFSIAFLGVIELETIITIIISGTVLKTFIEILVLPLTFLIVQKLKSAESGYIQPSKQR